MVCLPSLKTLQLENMTFVDDKSLQELLSICHVLEDLSVFFYNSKDTKEFSIIVPSLQSLSLFIPNYMYSDGYVIDTPSLKYLKLEDWNHINHYSMIKNMTKLREAHVSVNIFSNLNSVIGSITSVKHLTICSEVVYGNGFVFNQLEYLNLCVCKEESVNLLGQLLKDSPNLQVLDISIVEDLWVDKINGMVCWNQPSSVPKCLLSSLQSFN